MKWIVDRLLKRRLRRDSLWAQRQFGDAEPGSSWSTLNVRARRQMRLVVWAHRGRARAVVFDWSCQGVLHYPSDESPHRFLDLLRERGWNVQMQR